MAWSHADGAVQEDSETLVAVGLVRECAGEQLGGDVDDGDDALVSHAGRADDADRADHLAIDRVGGGNDAAFVECGNA
jgi:hypothetical protein